MMRNAMMFSLFSIFLLLASCTNNTIGSLSTTTSFLGLTANGTSGSVTTTELILSFDTDPTSLKLSDITVTGATKSSLIGTGMIRTLAITDITVANGENITVTVSNPSGFTITPNSKTVAVYISSVLPTTTSFLGLTANGTSGSVTTTELILSFDTDPTSLKLSDIAVTGATKSSLIGTGTTRTLAITDITVTNGENITVTVSNPSGFTITPSLKTVPVFIAAKKYKIGDIGPSGVGKVFYIIDDGLHGYEAALANWYNGLTDPSVPWVTGGTTQSSKNGNTLVATGTGLSNTNAIIAQSGHVTSAAQLCQNYNGGTKKDWFLPSKDELRLLFLQKSVFGDFSNYYWSSTEDDLSYAWGQAFFASGQQLAYPKNTNTYVRPIRAF